MVEVSGMACRTLSTTPTMALFECGLLNTCFTYTVNIKAYSIGNADPVTCTAMIAEHKRSGGELIIIGACYTARSRCHGNVHLKMIKNLREASNGFVCDSIPIDVHYEQSAGMLKKHKLHCGQSAF